MLPPPASSSHAAPGNPGPKTLLPAAPNTPTPPPSVVPHPNPTTSPPYSSSPPLCYAKPYHTRLSNHEFFCTPSTPLYEYPAPTCRHERVAVSQHLDVPLAERAAGRLRRLQRLAARLLPRAPHRHHLRRQHLGRLLQLQGRQLGQGLPCCRRVQLAGQGQGGKVALGEKRAGKKQINQDGEL